MARRNRTPEETKMAFALYFLLEPKKQEKGNPDVIKFSAAIDRTPAAVGLKLSNIASNDMNRIEAGRVGMTHASRLDREIWLEYDSRGDGLVTEALDLLAETTEQQSYEWNALKKIDLDFNSLPAGKERTAKSISASISSTSAARYLKRIAVDAA